MCRARGPHSHANYMHHESADEARFAIEETSAGCIYSTGSGDPCSAQEAGGAGQFSPNVFTMCLEACADADSNILCARCKQLSGEEAAFLEENKTQSIAEFEAASTGR